MINRLIGTALVFTLLTISARAEDSQACFGALPAAARVAECSKLIEKNPKDVPALLERAKINIELEHFADAISDAGRVLKMNSKSSVALRISNQAQAMQLKFKNTSPSDQPNDRLTELTKKIDANPNDAELYFQRSTEYQNLKDYGKALEDADRSIALNPKNSVYYQERARLLYFFMKKKDDAFATLVKAIDGDPGNISNYEARLRYHDYEKNLSGAAEDLKKIIELRSLEPGSDKIVTAWRRRYGIDLAKLGKRQEAVPELDHTIAADPNDVEAYQARIGIREFEKDLVGGEADYQKIIEIESRKPNNGPAADKLRRWRAMELAKQLRYDAAVTELDLVISGNPKDAAAFEIRGYVKGQAKQWQAAIADWDQVLAIEPKRWQSLANRCAGKAFLGNFVEAVRDCDDGIKLNPKYANLFKHRGVARLKLGQEAEGVADLDEAIKLSGSNYAAAFVARAEVYERQNHLAEAISHFELALKSTERPGNLDDITARETAKTALLRLKWSKPQ